MYLQYIWHLNFWHTHERLMLCDDTEGVYVRPGDIHALRQALGVLTEPHPCILPVSVQYVPHFSFHPPSCHFFVVIGLRASVFTRPSMVLHRTTMTQIESSCYS